MAQRRFVARAVEHDVLVHLVAEQEDAGSAQDRGQFAHVGFGQHRARGLCGLLIISIRVLGVIAARTAFQSGAKVRGSSATCTAFAPARSIAGS